MASYFRRASQNMSKDKWSTRGPIMENGYLIAMPDNVPAPLDSFIPEELLGKPMNNWHLKSVTIEQAKILFDYLSDKPVFLSCMEGKLIAPSGGYSVFKYNIDPSDPISTYGKSNVKQAMMREFFKIAKDANAEEYPVFFHIWLDTIKD